MPACTLCQGVRRPGYLPCPRCGGVGTAPGQAAPARRTRCWRLDASRKPPLALTLATVVMSVLAVLSLASGTALKAPLDPGGDLGPSITLNTYTESLVRYDGEAAGESQWDGFLTGVPSRGPTPEGCGEAWGQYRWSSRSPLPADTAQREAYRQPFMDACLHAKNYATWGPDAQPTKRYSTRRSLTSRWWGPRGVDHGAGGPSTWKVVPCHSTPS